MPPLSSVSTIHNDIATGNDESISDKTISNYLDALDCFFVYENIFARKPSLRSKTAIRTSYKRQFSDPSIATATMRLTLKKPLEDFKKTCLIARFFSFRNKSLFISHTLFCLTNDIFHRL